MASSRLATPTTLLVALGCMLALLSHPAAASRPLNLRHLLEDDSQHYFDKELCLKNSVNDNWIKFAVIDGATGEEVKGKSEKIAYGDKDCRSFDWVEGHPYFIATGASGESNAQCWPSLPVYYKPGVDNNADFKLVGKGAAGSGVSDQELHLYKHCSSNCSTKSHESCSSMGSR